MLLNNIISKEQNFIRTIKKEIEDLPFEVKIRVSPQAKLCRIIIKTKPSPHVELVMPKRYSLKKALAFLIEKRMWVENNLTKISPSTRLVDGMELKLNGIIHKIHLVKHNRPSAWTKGNNIFLSGPAESYLKTLKIYLKTLAHQVIKVELEKFVSKLNKLPQKISVRDQTSRWGSCSSNGNLSFSWRLILAPAEVLSYVVAHELAHLSEMNHSPKFWKEVEKLYPEYKLWRGWLKSNGSTLNIV